ncbi:MAG: hypothetical protein ACRDTA_18875 [Pseudonocardiaceae bacterium]
MKRRVFLALTGPALTAPAHQWLVHEPEPLMSGLAGRRVSGELVDRLSGMVAELRRMDDVAGGGGVLAMAQQTFAWVTALLDRASYNEHIGLALHVVLAELGSCAAGQLGTPGTTGWRSATTSLPCALPTAPMTGHWAPTSLLLKPTRRPAGDNPQKP